MTNQFTQLLLQSVDEVHEYQRNSPNAHLYGDKWFEQLAHRLERASSLNDIESVESEIDAIAYSIVDSGPLAKDFLPSFQKLLGAVQRRRKRSENESSN